MISHATFGIVAGVLVLLVSPLYVRGILAGETKPDRVTWWVLCLSSGLLTMSYYMSGARETMWLPAAYTVGFFVTALLSVFYGATGDTRLHIIDVVCLAAALVAAVVWWLTQSAPLAVFLFMGIEFFGLVPTVYKAYLYPGTEDRAAWIVTTIASVVNIFAIAEWSVVIAAYPIYVLATNAIILMFIIRPCFAPSGMRER